MHRTSNGLVMTVAGMALLWTVAGGGCSGAPPGTGDGPFAEPRIVVLEPVGDTAGRDAVRGRATLTRVDDALEMALQLQGLGDGGPHRAELAEGPCPTDAGPSPSAGDTADVVLSLDLAGGEDRAGEGPISRNASDIPPGTRLHVRVVGPDARLLACGALDDR